MTIIITKTIFDNSLFTESREEIELYKGDEAGANKAIDNLFFDLDDYKILSLDVSDI